MNKINSVNQSSTMNALYLKFNYWRFIIPFKSIFQIVSVDGLSTDWTISTRVCHPFFNTVLMEKVATVKHSHLLLVRHLRFEIHQLHQAYVTYILYYWLFLLQVFFSIIQIPLTFLRIVGKAILACH